MTLDFVEEFRSVVNENYGSYLDSIMGFQQTLASFEEKQKKLAESANRSIEVQDQIDFAHYSPEQKRFLHTETQGEFKKRMSTGNKNYNYAGDSFIISIFSYWEDHYREKIAKSLGLHKLELKEPIMGDIRKFRNSIIHHRAIALQEIEKCEVMRIFKEGELIKFTDKQILEIVDHINDYLDRFYTSD